MVRCNYCGEPLTFEGVEVLFFNHDGSDSWQKIDINECDNEALYISEKGKSCPTEILESISSINAEGRPIWKPMHMQPMYRMNEFITVNGSARAKTNAYIAGELEDVGEDIFNRGLCLPSDNKMTKEEQDRIIDIIKNTI